MPLTPADMQKGGRPRVRYTRRALILKISETTGLPRYKIAAALNFMRQYAYVTLRRGQRPYYPKLGYFTIANRKARFGKNPRTGATITISAQKSIRFEAGLPLKLSL